MKRRYLDQILKGVFDGEPVNGLNDRTEVAKELERCEWIKEGLESLKTVGPVPDVRERIKSQLLEQGLSGKSGNSIWTPTLVATASIAILLVIARISLNPTLTGRRDFEGSLRKDRVHSEEKVASNGRTMDVVTTSSGLVDALRMLAVRPDLLNYRRTSEPSFTQRESDSQSSRSFGPANSVKLATTQKTRVWNTQQSANSPTARGSTVAATNPPVVTVHQPASQAESNVVVIGPEVDSKSGASRAIEVKNPGDLLVGG